MLPSWREHIYNYKQHVDFMNHTFSMKRLSVSIRHGLGQKSQKPLDYGSGSSMKTEGRRSARWCFDL